MKSNNENFQLYTEKRIVLSMGSYLHISCLSLAFFLVVSQGGKGHIFNQLLELLIAGNKICLTVNLYQTDKMNDNRYC